MKTEQNPKSQASHSSKTKKQAESRAGSQKTGAQGAANGNPPLKKDYSKMKEAVERIKDPQSFEDLKHFYNIHE